LSLIHKGQGGFENLTKHNSVLSTLETWNAIYLLPTLVGDFSDFTKK
jgi:hypothetical protein